MLIKLLSKVKSITRNIDPEDILFALEYLNKYGYLNNSADSVQEFLNSLTRFQDFFDITVDGELGEETLNEMRLPRCSMPDFITENSHQYKWTKKNLTYYIKSRVNGIAPDDFDAVVEECAKDSMEICGLKFTRTNSPNADLVLDTGRSRREQFGSPSGVLAWSEIPMGDNRQILMKLDLAEPWTIDINKPGIYLKSVIAHETFSGHGVGLLHHKNKCALLFPQYQRHTNTPQKCYEIPQLQSRYGKPQAKPDPDPDPKPDPPETTVIRIKGNIKDISIPGYRVQKIG